MSRLNTQELIELTLLHSLGLLDEQDRLDYESALSETTPELREHIRAEARRMADLGDLLPDEEPSPELRAMVLSAVRAAMREQETERRIAHAPAERRHAQPGLARSSRVHPAWRAGTITMSAACITLFIVAINSQRVVDQVNPQARISKLYDSIGAEFVDATLFDPQTTRVALTPASAETTAVASVWHNPDWKSARLFVKNLKPAADAAPYRLVVLDDQGNVVREVAQFSPTGELQDFEISINPSIEGRLAIYNSIRDELNSQPVLQSVDSDL
jgi:anti-sigma-K factor RskA